MQPQQVAKLWEATQVELQGSYSNKRVVDLAKYTRETNLLRAWVVVVASPLPSLLVTFLIDSIPLADPSEGVAANMAFFVRHYLCILMTTSMVIHQFRRGMYYLLPYPTKPFVRDSLVVSAFTTGSLYVLSLVIGFPVPFSSLVILPGWTTITVAVMAVQWASRIRETPSAVVMLIGMAKLMVCKVFMISVYPLYYHIFTTLTEKSQTAFTMLLPLIKLLMRNLFARAVRHLGDETPELVIFNADAFGSLFVSYCMQSLPSIWSTMVIIAADAILIALSLRDILRNCEGLEVLEHQIDNGPIWRHWRGTLGFKLLGGRKPTTLERAGILLERGETKNSPPANPRSASTVHPAETNDFRARKSKPRTPITTKYTHKVQRLLYMAEFLLLLNYIEVVIPQHFAIYLIVTYHLPNRDYYEVFINMSESQLYETLYKLLVYWFLQLLSLLCLDILLRRILGLSPVRLLAFVFEKQGDFVQIHLTYWLCYNAQCALKHIGYDYTFHFAWLFNK
ncbi:hypothetical protein PHYSODRAFT_530048 [Phytophthora sojae]|uniref:Uncharacterized protein n=1 Tax=Phytophthora sojae (strain P6497) TaxID=1094619 RepID=G5ACB3_PHYSP|nr:hypothetical protein PHYSODRAFT_530048 [Phytophthora sojae]EGZ06987.1 hypothetical protein PHYSODRAFT_530048 [Phytophthora sojae]|eukprot:XP_009537751.1 hypothetical protein PHYSODRAFT_530048 [Phytophthora sojae]